MWAASLESPFLHILQEALPFVSCHAHGGLGDMGKTSKAQRPRVELSQPEKQTEMLVPRQLSLGGEDQAECKSRRESPQEEVECWLHLAEV